MDDARSKFIYEQLNTLKLGSSPAEDIQRLQDQVNIQAVNIDAMKTYNLINEATFRNDSCAIPGTSKLIKATATDSNKTFLFTPNEGEIWQLQGATVLANSGPGETVTYYLYARHGVDGSGPPEDEFDIYLGAESSGSTLVSLSEWFQDIGGNGTFTIDSKTSLYVEVSAMGTAARFDFYMLMIRLR
tara:strand:+ start:1086 stop:1646 length:561 start_codon:yes stop_codon:yes gene_type:complete